MVETLAGSGRNGARDGKAYVAEFSGPTGLVLSAERALYVCDTGNNRIRSISVRGTVATVAGSIPGLADGPGSLARFKAPSGIAADAHGNLFVIDSHNSIVRLVEPGSTCGDGLVTREETCAFCVGMYLFFN